MPPDYVEISHHTFQNFQRAVHLSRAEGSRSDKPSRRDIALTIEKMGYEAFNIKIVFDSAHNEYLWSCDLQPTQHQEVDSGTT